MAEPKSMTKQQAEPVLPATETAQEPQEVAAYLSPANTETRIPDDPFDLANLRLPQSFVESAGVKKLLTTVPVRKPNPQDFVRVHPSPEYRAPLAIIDLKDDREIYLVPKSIANELPGEFVMVTIFTAINRQGVVFLWPVRLPAADGSTNDWHKSAADAADRATRRWLRIKANMSLGAYEMFEAASSIPDPEWPELPFQELLRIAFRDRLIDRLDHPVISACADLPDAGFAAPSLRRGRRF
jgi:hypothetical protein